MKKSLFLCLSAFILLGLMASICSGQTANEILEKMIEAQGGRKTLETIKDTTLSGNIEMIQFGMKGVMTMYQKEPNKLRMDFEVMGMVISQGYDGQTAWMINPQTGAVEEMPEKFAADLRRQALGNDSLLHPEKYGITYEFKGKEKVRDQDCFILEQTASDGHKTTIYLAGSTFLTLKTKTKSLTQAGMEVDAETYFSDYKKIDGMPVPHSLTMYQDGQEFMRMSVIKVTYNTGLDDSLFKMGK